MADVGLTSTGFVPDTIPSIRDSIETDLRGTFGASLPLGDFTVLGHIVGIISERLGLLWERAEEINASQDPDAATDVSLDAICLLTGTFRLQATSSTAAEILGGDDGTVVAGGRLIATASTGKQFTTEDDVTIALQASWVAATPYVVFARVTNASRCYQCITAGTSAGSGGPTTTSDDITDGTVHWQYIGEGVGVADVNVRSVDTGPVVAIAGDLTLIQTPVAGWRSAKNLQDAELGRDLQTNQDLRLLREGQLAGSGAGTRDAIRAALLKLGGVTSVTMFVNSTDIVNSDGVPPHAFEALVLGGLDQEIVDKIADELPIGINTYGTSSGTHTDSEGVDETINYSRPSQVLMYVRIIFTYIAANYPGDGDVEVKTAISVFGAGFPTGQDVDPSAIGAQAFAVAGVFGVSETLVYNDVIGAPVAWAPTTAYVATPGSRSVVTNDGRTYICITAGTSAGSGGPLGTSTNIIDGTVHWRFLGAKYVIAARELAKFDTTRTTVTSSAVAP